jgi:myo-inositol catabolism protein IolC
MRADLSSGASKLALALKQLHIKWEAARETWDDATARAFHREHIEPLAPKVKETLEAIGRLAAVLARATRDVSDTNDL